MESLHLSFQKIVSDGMFEGVSIGSAVKLSHLFFADDVVFMGQWSDSDISNYSACSGMIFSCIRSSN